jgi:hypothetical protein
MSFGQLRTQAKAAKAARLSKDVWGGYEYANTRKRDLRLGTLPRAARELEQALAKVKAIQEQNAAVDLEHLDTQQLLGRDRRAGASWDPTSLQGLHHRLARMTTPVVELQSLEIRVEPGIDSFQSTLPVGNFLLAADRILAKAEALLAEAGKRIENGFVPPEPFTLAQWQATVAQGSVAAAAWGNLSHLFGPDCRQCDDFRRF